MLNFKEVLGYDFVSNSMDELGNELEHRLINEIKTFIVTANPEILTYAHAHPSYKMILKKANYVIPDGVGIILASKILENPLQGRLAGFDLMERLLQIANKRKLRIYLLGTKPNIIEFAAANIQKKYPFIKLAGFHHGYFSKDDDSIVEEIKKKNPDIVFVGLGFPKQEKWISKNLPHLQKGVFIGVGGSLNVWAGVEKRAPKIWRTLNIEWLYRAIKQPARVKRLAAIPIFLRRVIQLKFRILLHVRGKQN